MNVIKTLRRKFILISTATVIIIVAGVLGLVNTIAHMRVYTQIETYLAYIAQNSESPLPKKILQDGSWFGETEWSDDTPAFIVIITPEGYVKEARLKNITAFTKNEAVQYVLSTLNMEKQQGFLKKDRATYAYAVTRTKQNDICIAVMDCTRDMAIVQDFMWDSLLLGCICILLYVFILAVLSNQAIKPFVRNLENQKRFITNAGHELKTPIAIISANTEAMEYINGKNQWTESILKQTKRLSKLINDLIILAKVGEKTQSEFIFTRVNFSETVTEVVKSFEQMAIEQKKRFIYHIEPEICVRSEGKCLYELVNILVDNAVKYCDDEGEIKTQLTVAGRKKKEAVLTVANDFADGKNIDYSQFFERFYRGDISHSNEKAGYGIGLSIARELVQLLKGKIQIDYAEGKITFTVKFSISDK